ncbi:MAG: T9SS type A sorting domain-containing protein, partial [Bacteroidetes bacterium]|nr:T9SS type A sorting domain-containing protein [Bacteroidota bacterium]
TTTGATLGWTAATNAISYNVQYKLSSATSWTTVNVTTTSKVLTGLTAGTSYQFQVQTVCSAGNSAYSSPVTFTTTATGCTDTWESNNTAATAKLITVGTNINALIGTSTDVDYFKFSNTNSQKKIKITLTNLPADYDIRLYKSNGTTQVGISQNGGTTSETITYNNGAVGTYIIKVYGYSGAYNATSCYTLMAQISASNFKTEDPGTIETETETANPLTLYPNPTTGTLNVEFNSAVSGNTTIRVFDLTGRTVYSEIVESKEGLMTRELNLQQLQKGLYFVEISNSGQKLTEKLLISWEAFFSRQSVVGSRQSAVGSRQYFVGIRYIVS